MDDETFLLIERLMDAVAPGIVSFSDVVLFHLLYLICSFYNRCITRM